MSLSLYPILAAFMATMVDAGGNAGGQSSTLIIRSLALGDIELKDWWKVFLREVYLGAIMGAVLGVTLFLRGFMITSNVSINFSAGVAIFLIMIFSNSVGAMLPFVGKLFKIDPAVMSGPLVTTIADLVGMLIYFSIATLILGI